MPTPILTDDILARILLADRRLYDLVAEHAEVLNTERFHQAIEGLIDIVIDALGIPTDYHAWFYERYAMGKVFTTLEECAAFLSNARQMWAKEIKEQEQAA